MEVIYITQQIKRTYFPINEFFFSTIQAITESLKSKREVIRFWERSNENRLINEQFSHRYQSRKLKIHVNPQLSS